MRGATQSCCCWWSSASTRGPSTASGWPSWPMSWSATSSAPSCPPCWSSCAPADPSNCPSWHHYESEMDGPADVITNTNVYAFNFNRSIIYYYEGCTKLLLKWSFNPINGIRKKLKFNIIFTLNLPNDLWSKIILVIVMYYILHLHMEKGWT